MIWLKNWKDCPEGGAVVSNVYRLRLEQTAKMAKRRAV